MQFVVFILIALFVLKKITFFLTPTGVVLWLIVAGTALVFSKIRKK